MRGPDINATRGADCTFPGRHGTCTGTLPGDGQEYKPRPDVMGRYVLRGCGVGRRWVRQFERRRGEPGARSRRGRRDEPGARCRRGRRQRPAAASRRQPRRRHLPGRRNVLSGMPRPARNVRYGVPRLLMRDRRRVGRAGTAIRRWRFRRRARLRRTELRKQRGLHRAVLRRHHGSVQATAGWRYLPGRHDGGDLVSGIRRARVPAQALRSPCALLHGRTIDMHERARLLVSFQRVQRVRVLRLRDGRHRSVRLRVTESSAAAAREARW